VMERVERVREFRSKSERAATNELAQTPTVFGELRQPRNNFLFVPKTSSERRRYAPIGFMPPEAVINNTSLFIDAAELFHFGVLSSTMHMAWLRQVGGRLKSDYRYSNKLVYNNYPWPESVSEKPRSAVETAAQKVLSVRAEFLAPVAQASLPAGSPGIPARCSSSRRTGSTDTPRTRSQDGCATKTATLADLYDPLATPPALQQAHEALDRAVDKCYRPEPFTSERQRVEFLFALYEKLTAPLVAAAQPKRQRKKPFYSQPLPKPSPPESEPAAAAFYNLMGKEETTPYRTNGGKP
jgi:hypothetical protein